MNLRTRAVAVLLAGTAALLTVGAGVASAAEPPAYGPEWTPGYYGPEWSATPGTGPEWQPGANPGTADLLDGLLGGLFGR